MHSSYVTLICNDLLGAISVTIKINQVFFIFNTREISVNKKDLWALTLVGLNWGNPVLDPLAVQHLDNQLCKYM